MKILIFSILALCSINCFSGISLKTVSEFIYTVYFEKISSKTRFEANTINYHELNQLTSPEQMQKKMPASDIEQHVKLVFNKIGGLPKKEQVAYLRKYIDVILGDDLNPLSKEMNSNLCNIWLDRRLIEDDSDITESIQLKNNGESKAH